MSVIADLAVVLSADTTRLDAGLNKANKGILGFTQDAGKALTGLGMSMTGLTAPLLAFGVTGVGVAADFETSMAEISARTGIVGQDLQSISDFALQMGADTSFSSQQAADAFLQLLSSGQNAEQAIATLPAVLDLAAASGADLGATADSVTDIMAQFGLDVSNAAMVTDVLAQAAGASSASISDLAAGFGNVGGVAKAFGLDVQTTTAILAIFAENGTKGAEAGTALKSILTNFTSDRAQTAFETLGVSMYDAQGNMRDFETVIGDLDTALDALPIEQQNALMLDLAGSYGITGLTALRGSISISAMEASMAGSANAAAIAEARMNTFRGKVDSLFGSVQALQIRAFTPLMQNSLTPMVGTITNVVNAITDFVVANPELTSTLLDMGIAATVAGPAIAVIGLGITALASPMILTGVAITAVIAGVVGLKSAFDNFIGSGTTAQLVDGMMQVTTPADRLREALNTIQIGDTTLGEIVASVDTAIQGALAQVSIVSDDVVGIKTDIEAALSGISIDTTALTALPQQIADQIGVSFESGITVDTGPAASWMNQNSQMVLDTIVSVAGIVFGGPLGMAIGGASLVASAIENDFLGIGTFLDTSGISAAVTTAFNDVKNLIDDIIASIFGGGGGQTVTTGADFFDVTSAIIPNDFDQGKTDVLGKIASDISLAITTIKNVADGIGADVGKGLADLGAGVSAFVSGISGAETSGLYDAMRPILGVISGLAIGAAQIAGFGVGAILGGIGAALGPFGEGIGGLITSVSRLGEGDIGGALQSFGGAILSFGQGILAFPASIADSVLEKIENIAGVQLPDVSTGLAAWGPAIENAWFIAQVAFDNIRRGLASFSLDIQLSVLNFVADMRQRILDLSGGQFDIAPTIELSRQNLQFSRDTFDVAPLIEAELRADLAAGSIDISDTIANTIQYGMQVDPAALAAGFSVTGKMAVEEALAQAFTITDQQTIDILSPLAVALGIDIAGVEAQVKADLAAGNYDTTVTANVAVNAVVTFLQNVPGMINEGIAAAGGFLTDLGAAVAPPDGVPGLDVGTPLVQSDGLIYAHQGEAVLTPEQTRSWHSMMKAAGVAAPSSGGGSSGNSGSSGRGGDIYLTSWGDSPREVARMLQRERELGGLN